MLSKQVTKKIAELPELKSEILDKLENDQGLISVENIILDWLNSLGTLLVDEIINEVPEPVVENKIIVNDKEMKYHGDSKRMLKSRFGGNISFIRRIYREHDGSKFVKNGESLSPLEEKLGVDKQGGLTPALSYITTLCGANDAYNPASKTISELLQISISASGVQKTTELIGAKLPVKAEDIIPKKVQSQNCEAFIISLDATGSPRISDEPCKKPGRESLTNPTIAKMCSVIQVEKFHKKLTPRSTFKDQTPKADESYTMASFGDESFDEVRQLVRKAGSLGGHNRAKVKIFKGDGLPSNWKIHNDFFHNFIPILDPYHALEHLAKFCRTSENLKETDKLGKNYLIWKQMILDGEILQVINELKERMKKFSGKKKENCLAEIAYFENNRERMYYDSYLNMGIPIGSGNIESACKRVVAHRFKKQGMRWRRADNQSVLNARLHLINGTLKQQFLNQIKCSWSIKNAA